MRISEEGESEKWKEEEVAKLHEQRLDARKKMAIIFCGDWVWILTSQAALGESWNRGR